MTTQLESDNDVSLTEHGVVIVQKSCEDLSRLLQLENDTTIAEEKTGVSLERFEFTYKKGANMTDVIKTALRKLTTFLKEKSSEEGDADFESTKKCLEKHLKVFATKGSMVTDSDTDTSSWFSMEWICVYVGIVLVLLVCCGCGGLWFFRHQKTKKNKKRASGISAGSTIPVSCPPVPVRGKTPDRTQKKTGPAPPATISSKPPALVHVPVKEIEELKEDRKMLKKENRMLKNEVQNLRCDERDEVYETFQAIANTNNPKDIVKL